MGENKKILVVDDSETNVFLLQKLLEEEGFDIEYAYSGKEALKLLNSKTYFLVLMDIMMPGIDGYDILQKLKETNKLKSTPIIMVTARDDTESQDKALQMGASDYLTKPLDLKKLKDIIKQY
ncbi:MAG: PleD family two-component system response regulator [Bacteroidales bacterium]